MLSFIFYVLEFVQCYKSFYIMTCCWGICLNGIDSESFLRTCIVSCICSFWFINVIVCLFLYPLHRISDDGKYEL